MTFARLHGTTSHKTEFFISVTTGPGGDSNDSVHITVLSVSIVLKATTVKSEKQPLLGDGCVTSNNGVAVGSGVSCEVCAEAI
jgi:hypothetical protein